jgi:UDP-3-O-[3-hydroxymyristoyl] glucosamine N-acyltransferase
MEQYTAAQVAEIINGKIEGDPQTSFHSFAKIEEARLGDISFMSTLKFEDELYKTTASVVVINEDYKVKHPISPVIIRVPDAYKSFVILLTHFQQNKFAHLKGQEQPCFIGEGALLGTDVYIGAFTYIGSHAKIGKNTKIFPNCFIGQDVEIGENCVIHAGVKIYHECKVKNNVVIHAGTAIGGDGFGYTPGPQGLMKVPQIGNVVIEDNVEIGCNTCIDRATMGSTLVKSGTKIDNLIQIAHNVVVGHHTVIAGQSGIGGSTKIGNGVMIGGQVAVVEHISIADGSKIGAQAKVTKTVKSPNSNLNDAPAFDYAKSLKAQAIYRNLPELEKRVKDLEDQNKKHAE